MKLRLIMVADTHDSSIGDSVEADARLVIEWMQTVAEHIDVPLEKTVITGDAYTKSRVRDAVRELEVDADDSVLFWYSGHGFRTPGKEEQWPYLAYQASPYDMPEGLDEFEVFETLRDKNPRLLLVACDCCNSVIDIDIEQSARSVAHVPRDQLQEAYRRLFVESSGVLLAASSQPGEYSFCSSLGGGVFTLAFLEAVEQSIRGADVRWEAIMEIASEPVPAPANPTGYQTPIYEMNMGKPVSSGVRAGGAARSSEPVSLAARGLSPMWGRGVEHFKLFSQSQKKTLHKHGIRTLEHLAAIGVDKSGFEQVCELLEVSSSTNRKQLKQAIQGVPAALTARSNDPTPMGCFDEPDDAVRSRDNGLLAKLRELDYPKAADVKKMALQTGVKNQGQRGTCVAFAATKALETLIEVPIAESASSTESCDDELMSLLDRTVNRPLEGKELIGLYFSASWCPPCREFTPQLKGFYNSAGDSSFEIALVTWDKTSDAEEYYRQMPWAAVDFEDNEALAWLRRKYAVRGVPTLVILNGCGKLLARDGRQQVVAGLDDPQTVIQRWKNQEPKAPELEQFSPQFLYWHCKQGCDNSDQDGTWPHTALNMLREHGDCLEPTMPYVSTSCTPKCGPAPPQEAATEAKEYPTAEGIHSCEGEAGVWFAKAALSGQTGLKPRAVFGSWYLYTSFNNRYTEETGHVNMPLPSEEFWGHHAMCVVGYQDDEGWPGGGYLLVLNSWGAGWASKSPDGPGICRIPYAYADKYQKTSAVILLEDDEDEVFTSARNRGSSEGIEEGPPTEGPTEQFLGRFSFESWQKLTDEFQAWLAWVRQASPAALGDEVERLARLPLWDHVPSGNRNYMEKAIEARRSAAGGTGYLEGLRGHLSRAWPYIVTAVFSHDPHRDLQGDRGYRSLDMLEESMLEVPADKLARFIQEIAADPVSRRAVQPSNMRVLDGWLGTYSRKSGEAAEAYIQSKREKMERMLLKVVLPAILRELSKD